MAPWSLSVVISTSCRLERLVQPGATMARYIAWLLGFTLLAAGCDVTVTSVDDEANPNDPNDPNDPNPPGPKTKQGECGLIDIGCPSARPFPGSPCEGSFSCTYEDEVAIITSTCANDAWTESVECTEEVIGGSCGGTPPASESCTSPFSGSMEATLEVGPPPGSQAFRPFEEGELISPEIGGQGSAMVWFTLRMDGDELPDCARVTATLESGVFYDPGQQISDVKLRCGASLGMYSVVPYADCENLTEGDVVDVTLTVEVAGIGEASYPLRLAYEDVCFIFG